MQVLWACSAFCFMSFFVIIAEGLITSAHLVYPPTMSSSPNKVQLVLGLGIPMEINVSTIMGYVMKYNYYLPSNASYFEEPYVRLQRSTAKDITGDIFPRIDISQSTDFTATDGRYVVYKMVETAIDSTFHSGKACLLRAICEAAITPLNVDNGLLAQLLHVFLTPSSTSESYREMIDQEYLAAESIGRQCRPNECSWIFSECDTNFLDYFSDIY